MQALFHQARALARNVGDDLNRLLGDPTPEGGNSPQGHRPTVLLVEGDNVTRRAMGDWLARRGFSVLAATTGGEAARQLDQPPQPIDVAVVDLGLPDVNGVVLCEVIQEFHPFLPVLVCSDRASREDLQRLHGAGVRRVLPRPVDPEELVSAVEEVLP
jgi:two-component system OmpR family response regulator